MEHELYSTREELQNTVEELEDTNEEMKASNEETMSMNEELQSTNEELETSKEELQSLNEELSTVNSELQDKILLLIESNNDVTNLVNSTAIATLFLDKNLHIKFYSPSAKNLFNLIPTDFDRPIEHITARFDNLSMRENALQVLNTLKSSTKEVKSENNEWFLQRILPYRTQDNRIEGVVITFENITQLVLSREHYKSLFQGINHGVAIYKAIDNGKDFVFLDMNPGGERISNVKKTDIVGQRVTKVFPGIITMGLLEAFKTVWETEKPQSFPVAHYQDDRLESWIENFIYQLDSGEIVATYRDVTSEKQQQLNLTASNSEMTKVMNLIQDLILYVDSQYRIKWLNDAAVKFIGKSRADIIGLTCHDIWCLTDQNCAKCPLTHALQHKKGIESSVTDGSGQQWKTKVEPLFDKNGEIETVVEIRSVIAIP